MKTLHLQNSIAACAGRALLYCYRSYIILLKETRTYQPMETPPATGRFVRFTSNQFTAPCYN